MIGIRTAYRRGVASRPDRPRKSRRAIVVTTTLIAALSMLVACGGSTGSSAGGSTSSDDTVRVGVIAGSPPGVYSAIENGFFAKEHIQVKLVTLSGGPALVAATAGGSVDVAWGDIFAWTAAIEQGFKLTIINPANGLKAGQQVNVIMAKPGSGITSAKGLAGKRLGVPAQALTTVQIKKWLADQGLDANGPTYTTVQDRTTAGGLVAQGTIDAAATSGASVTQWQAQYGLVVAGTYDSGIPDGAATSGYGALASYAQDHPDLIKRFVAAVREGVAVFQTDPPADQNKMLVKYGGADVGKLEAKYPGALAAAAAANGGELRGPFNVAAENKWVAVGVQYGALKAPLDITPYLWTTATA